MNTSTLPFFTVVIPLFNKRAFIERAVTSVLGQDDIDFELLVVDDGSTDGSSSALAHIADPRLIVHRQANSGVGAARNAGMRLARGRWIAFLDADDAWWPSHLAELRRVIAACPEAGMVATACIETHGSSLPRTEGGRRERAIRKVDYFAEAARCIGFLNASCAAVRQDVPQRVGGFSGHKAGEDLEYWARVALSFEVAVSERVTSAYFRIGDSAMARLGSNAQGRQIRQLADVSPSVAMLCNRVAANDDPWADASIRRYVNARLHSAMKACLVQGNCTAARQCAQLLLPPFTAKDRLFRLLTSLPAGIQAALISSYRQLAPVLRRAATRLTPRARLSPQRAPRASNSGQGAADEA